MPDHRASTFTMNTTPLHPKALTKLPDMAVYGPGVAGSVKRKTLVTVPPIQGSSFTPSGQRIIQIFLPKNGFYNGVNSYLTFTHWCPISNDREQAALSTSASNWIQRLRIKIGGRIVEDIDDYNVLHEIIRTSVVTAPFRDSLAGQTEGYEPSHTVKCTEECITDGTAPDSLPQYWNTDAGVNNAWRELTSATHNTAAFRNSVYPVRGGVRVNVNRSGKPSNGIDATSDFYPDDSKDTLQRWAREKKQYQIKLLSGFLESRRYVPTRFMPPVEIELTLADFSRSHVWQPARPVAPADLASKGQKGQPNYLPARPVAGRGGALQETSLANKTYTIEGVNLMCEMLEFDETFYQAFEMSLAQGVTIPYTTFTNHVFSHSGSTTDFQIAERVRSAKALFAVMRRNNDMAYPAYPKFVFHQNGLQQYQVKVGTQYFPMQPIECAGTGNAVGDPYSGTRLTELTKCISAMADTTHAMTANSNNFHQMFVIGVDLDREFNRLSGLDTTKGLPLFLNLRHGTLTDGAVDVTHNKPCQLNVFVHYDMFVDLFPGEVIEVLN